MGKCGMKKNFILGLLLVVCAASYAQQQAQYSQYMLNYYLINPAVSGTEDFTDIKVGYRNQWTGLAGAPVNYYVSGHTPIGKMHESNSRFHKGKPKKPHHTLGGLVTGQELGAFTHTGIYATYAYHAPLSQSFTLSMGVSGGVQNYYLDQNKLNFGDAIVDPAATASINSVKPDVNAGFWLYSKKIFAGISSMQLLRNKLDFTPGIGSNTAGAFNRHFYLTGGYMLEVTPDVKIIPSVLIKSVIPQSFQIDLNTKVRYRDFMWAGFGYRKTDAFVVLVGGVIANTVELGYSYDLSTSKLSTVSNGSHEVMVGVRLHSKGKVICPGQYW
jgi:type IX secretion system PorP/SprF family membrane protein